MKYYLNKTLKLGFDETVQKVIQELEKEGFGVLSEIDVKKKLKDKINVDFKKYKILGACNPPFAHQALQIEERIGLFLPCNVIVYESEGGVEVAAIDPTVAMQVVPNPELEKVAESVKIRLEHVIKNL